MNNISFIGLQQTGSTVFNHCLFSLICDVTLAAEAGSMALSV